MNEALTELGDYIVATRGEATAFEVAPHGELAIVAPASHIASACALHCFTWRSMPVLQPLAHSGWKRSVRNHDRNVHRNHHTTCVTMNHRGIMLTARAW